MKITDEQLEKYRQARKETESVYSAFVRGRELSGAECWLIWAVFNGCGTQKDAADMLFMSKQTINSACRKLEEDGYVTLGSPPGDRRAKIITLTDKGLLFARSHIDAARRAEEEAWNRLDEGERRALSAAAVKFNTLLKERLEKTRQNEAKGTTV